MVSRLAINPTRPGLQSYSHHVTRRQAACCPAQRTAQIKIGSIFHCLRTHSCLSGYRLPIVTAGGGQPLPALHTTAHKKLRLFSCLRVRPCKRADSALRAYNVPVPGTKIYLEVHIPGPQSINRVENVCYLALHVRQTRRFPRRRSRSPPPPCSPTPTPKVGEEYSRPRLMSRNTTHRHQAFVGWPARSGRREGKAKNGTGGNTNIALESESSSHPG